MVEQSEDGRKFNRGQLLNIGAHLAALAHAEALILHDVDLLPSEDMREVYRRPPPRGCAVHLASVWGRLGEEELSITKHLKTRENI